MVPEDPSPRCQLPTEIEVGEGPQSRKQGIDERDCDQHNRDPDR